MLPHERSLSFQKVRRLYQFGHLSFFDNSLLAWQLSLPHALRALLRYHGSAYRYVGSVVNEEPAKLDTFCLGCVTSAYQLLGTF